MVTKGEEKTKVLNAFFASGFSNRASFIVGIQPSELENSNQEQNDLPAIQDKMANDLLQHQHIHKSMGLDGIH